MRIPIVRGLIDRRILVNFRVDPEVLARLLPSPFRPKLVNGVGMAGVCLIRLKHIRPRFLPGVVGISSENAAHRIAVEWDQDGSRHEGVFIPRRDTSSRLNTLAGGRLFPGEHHHARFQVEERNDHYRVALDSDDGRTHLLVEESAGRRTAGRLGLPVPPGGIGLLRTRGAGLLGDQHAGRVRRPGAAELSLAGPAAGRGTGGIELLPGSSPVSPRRGRVRLGPADARD